MMVADSSVKLDDFLTTVNKQTYIHTCNDSGTDMLSTINYTTKCNKTLIRSQNNSMNSMCQSARAVQS